jgi:nucleoside-diphosphate-sugar epimerase
MNKIKKVSMLGCGWVGNALKASLESKDNIVQCLLRDTKLNRLTHFYDVDVLVIAIPPSTQEYLDVLEESVYYLKKENHTQVIFLSSISFYDGKQSVIEAEKLMQQLLDDVVILRLGGLMGYDRVAGKYTAGKVLTSDARTNYVHRDDVVGIIESIIFQDVREEVFDVVSPLQSSKKEIFMLNAKKFGFKPTEFLNGDKIGKVLSPNKLIDTINYNFTKPDVREFWD